MQDIIIKKRSVNRGPDICAAGNKNKSKDEINKNLWYGDLSLNVI